MSAEAKNTTETVQAVKKTKGTSRAPAIKLRFKIDVTVPAKEGVIKVADLVKFLHEKIKVNNKTNNLGETVKITNSGNVVQVVARTQMSKRYMKYLTKKYLKSQSLRDMMRVIAADKETYKVVFLAIDGGDEEEAEDTKEDEKEEKAE